MKKNKDRIKAIFLFAAAAFFLGDRGLIAVPANHAKAKFEEQSWDFGKVKQGEVLSHDFIFKNEGNVLLVIQRVSTSCGCTAALASDDKIEPGKEGKITASFDTRGYSGKVVKHIYVESNDSGQGRRELSLAADIDVPPRPKIELDRYNIDMGISLLGEEASTKVTIRNLGKLELKVEFSPAEMTFLSGSKAAVFPLKIAAGKSSDIEIKFTGQNRTGVLRDYVLIKSNDPVRSTISLYISRYIINREELKNLFIKYKKILEGTR